MYILQINFGTEEPLVTTGKKLECFNSKIFLASVRKKRDRELIVLIILLYQ